MPPKETEEWNAIADQRAREKKTHVSFPQLKYPSLRDNGLRDPAQWLVGKAMDDGAEGLWRVHDKLYDFENFMKLHPGGEEWLELTKGTDITEAFETHHLNPYVEKQLDNFYVKDAKTPRNSPFTFKEDGFYRTLKKSVFEEMKKNPRSDYKLTDTITDSLFITFAVSSALAPWVTNYNAYWLWSCLAALSLAHLTVASHNYIHRKTNLRMYFFNLSMWSYRDFRIMHALSHHLYTNTLMDLELSALEPLIYFFPRKDKPVHAKYYGLLIEVFFMWPFSFIIAFTKRFLLIFTRPGFFTAHYRWHDGIWLLVPLWMWLASGAPLGHVLTTWLWIVCMGSFIFFTIGYNAAHYHPEAIKDGDQPRTETPDWGVHQIEALFDRKDINSHPFTTLTFFGEHTLHHLFPTLDHGVLKHLHPLLVDLAEKYEANYRVTTQFKMVIAQIKELHRTEYKPATTYLIRTNKKKFIYSGRIIESLFTSQLITTLRNIISPA